MKFKILTISLFCIFASACNVVMHPQFTNVVNILSTSRGETINAVIEKIGHMPYDVFTQQTTGYKIVSYKYKIMERQIDPTIKEDVGSEIRGEKKYLPKLNTVFFIFDASDKLISYITESGRKDAKSLLVDHEMILNYPDYIGDTKANNMDESRLNEVIKKYKLTNSEAKGIMLNNDSNKSEKSKKPNPLLP